MAEVTKGPYPFTLTRSSPFKEAIAYRRGGISVKDTRSTMESKRVEGTYFAGELCGSGHCSNRRV